jgi:hypothetical protein
MSRESTTRQIRYTLAKPATARHNDRRSEGSLSIPNGRNLNVAIPAQPANNSETATDARVTCEDHL